MAKILVIDDDTKILEAITEILKEYHHDAITISDPEDIDTHLEDRSIDLVVTDLIMPTMDGLEVISRIRSNYPGIKILAMSGGAKAGPDSYLPLSKMLGANEIIEKPFTIAELMTAINKLL